MENQVHTPLRHIGYHKASKSQLNIFASSPDIKRPTIVETPMQVSDNKAINVIESMISFLEQKNTVDDEGTATTNENVRLKEKNEKLKESIAKMENKIMTRSLTGENVYTNNSNESYQRLTNANKELKRRNMKLKSKLKELEYILNSTNMNIVNILENKKEFELKIKSTILSMQNFLNLLGQTSNDDEVRRSSPVVNDLNLYTSTNENLQRNFTNFSEAENLNTSTDKESEKNVTEQTENGSNEIQISLKNFEMTKNDSVLINSNYIKKKENHNEKMSHSSSNFNTKKNNLANNLIYSSSSSQRSNFGKNNISKVTATGIKQRVKKAISKTDRKI